MKEKEPVIDWSKLPDFEKEDMTTASHENLACSVADAKPRNFQKLVLYSMEIHLEFKITLASGKKSLRNRFNSPADSKLPHRQTNESSHANHDKPIFYLGMLMIS